LKRTARTCRARREAKDDLEWLAQVEQHGGISVSGDGIQPEKGTEPIDVVRDALDLTGPGRRERDVVGDGGE